MRIKFEANDEYIEVVKDERVIHKITLRHPGQLTLPPIEDPGKEVIDEVFSCFVKDLPDNFHISGEYFPGPSPRIDWVNLKKENGKTVLRVVLVIKLIEWCQPYTITDFLNFFDLKDKDDIHTKHYIDDYVVQIEAKVNLSYGDSINERCRWLAESIDSMYLEALTSMNKEVLGKHILRSFEFPSDYKAICAQYLMWFGEFLEKFGINALISVNNEGNETQVIISSEHTEKMFHEIEALFSQYIALPYAELRRFSR